MKTLLRSIVAFYAVALLLGCDRLHSGNVSVGGNPNTGDVSGMVEIFFKDSQGNQIVRRYPRTHPAVQHLLANP